MIHIPMRHNSFWFRRYADMTSIYFDRELLKDSVACVRFLEGKTYPQGSFLGFRIPLEAIRALMMISWSSAMGKMVVINHIDKPIIIRNEDVGFHPLLNPPFQALLMKHLNGDEIQMCELLSVEALEAFCLALLSCDQMHRIIAPPTAHRSADNIYAFLTDVLFTTDSELIRTALITSAICIVQYCGQGEQSRAQYLIDLLFENIDNVEDRNPNSAQAFFTLLIK